MSIDDLLALEDPVLESKFHAGNPAYKEVRFEDFKSQLPYYEKELKRKGVTRKLLWEEYDQANTNGYRYTQFCYHLKQQMVARKPSAVLIHNPAEKIFVDFAGAKLPLIDRDTGEVIWCPVFVACLPYSDYGFAMAVRTQGIEDFIYALRCCLEFFGGSPQILVPDNLKTAVIKANRYAPEITRALEDFCNFYNITVIPARVVSPKDKALVENQVKLVYNRVYAKLRNSQFFSLFDLNKAIREKIIQHNQTRMQQKPYCREERFLQKHLLQPLPTEPYEIKYYKDYLSWATIIPRIYK
jgi:transposase